MLVSIPPLPLLFRLLRLVERTALQGCHNKDSDVLSPGKRLIPDTERKQYFTVSSGTVPITAYVNVDGVVNHRGRQQHTHLLLPPDVASPLPARWLVLEGRCARRSLDSTFSQPLLTASRRRRIACP